MKYGMLIAVLGAVALIAAGVATTAFAQFGPNGRQADTAHPGRAGGPRGGMPAVPTMRFAGDGLFIVTGAVVTKYDATTLEARGKVTLESPTSETDGADAQTVPAGRPTPPPLLIASDDASAPALLVIAGNTFYRIRTTDLKVVTKASLPVTAPAPGHQGIATDGHQPRQGRQDGPPMGGPGMGMGVPGGPGMGGPGRGMPPGMGMPYELHGDTLYLLRPGQLLALNTLTGAVSGKAALALPTPPAPPAE